MFALDAVLWASRPLLVGAHSVSRRRQKTIGQVVPNNCRPTAETTPTSDYSSRMRNLTASAGGRSRSTRASESGLCHVSDDTYWDLKVGRPRPMVVISSEWEAKQPPLSIPALKPVVLWEFCCRR
ncbi:hypothetical protein KQX54_007062 [Cotesia glomerata]|uniref:Secreted protein n=1 Tax=Cotesia glomerata TaxID=32391 RepID=A0AAV7IT70_COTGL|nr:hypothetical protein KQX54_007062 [Cotesia glomerata]